MEKKKALFIIAPKNFRDEEYFKPRVVLLSAGIGTKTCAKTDKEEATGTLGGKARIEIKLGKAASKNYDALVLVGGSGAQVYFEDKVVHQLVKEFVEAGKVVAAICIAPSILANTGVLKAKKATSFPSEKSNLVSKGAIFVNQGVVTDGKIVTAEGPETAIEFGEAIVKVLQ